MPTPRPQAPTDTPILRCALPAPLQGALDYLPPEGFNPEQLVPGVRVKAPLGKRLLTGVLLEVHATPDVPLTKLKRVEAILDATPLLDSHLLSLLRWTASYYLHPPGETLSLGLAPRERRGEPPAPTGRPGLALNERGRGLPEGGLKRAPKQAQLLALLQQRPHSFEELDAVGISRAVARELLTKNLVERVDIESSHDWQSHPALAANAEQLAAINAINATPDRFSCHLLEGVTGSGKTEVYLQCIAPVLARGRQVLVLLPEIGLTPQMIRRFEARFDAPIALLHSGLSDGERERHWARARSGQAGIVLGTRSAVFAPLANPGLIIVDEEHDGSFRQQDGLRYSARDIAVKRAHLYQCTIVLGSATPSLETTANATSGRYHHHQLTQRAGGARQPSKQVVDIRGLELMGGLSKTLCTEVSATLARGEQALLFINRRGFAPTLLCHDCGWVAECRHCDARMTLHRQPAGLRCHHCDFKQPVPRACPSCASRRLVSTGVGTEQTEQQLKRLFPSTVIHRVDSDSMSGRHAMADFTTQMELEGPCIIVGTQMLTKGHHFPKVTCVGVIDADSLLFSPDFRGEERLAQLLTQVGGRAGRADSPGTVLIQTHHPEHPLMAAALARPYAEISALLLADRRARTLPPYGALGMLRCDSRQPAEGINFLQRVADAVRPQLSGASLVGPINAAMARRAGLYRAQLVIHARQRADMATAAALVAAQAASQKSPAGLRWFMDIDPVDSG